MTAIIAIQENLGDLKLYRIPEPVTVAANSQKQVALLTRPDVRIALVYRQSVYRREAAAQAALAGDPGADRAQPRGGRARPAAAGGQAGPVRRARPAGRCCSAKAR